MTDAAFDELGRPEPPAHDTEERTLLGFLDFLRATIGWKTAGLNTAQLEAKPLSSTMTLGGMLKHLAYVEDFWFGRVLSGRDPHKAWATVDWRANPNFDWESAAGHSPDELHALWSAAVDRSRHLWRTQATQPGFTLEIDYGLPNGERVSARWVLTHMIEEYARHCGHADLLREALDGATGE
ncbi:DinB family protein [Tessaracoccus massiliensis]|uniref:DinB family protein n=1 Tax=Tessaracoccus massiliensis TaxID=1522311 RepID=UPI000590576A|nr:DinB family protein [Tessaracoccus massiliensis]